MTADELFAGAVAGQALDADAPALLHALWHEARGDWQRAHEIVQQQAGARAAAVHAYLHRREGDLANADYWYARAGLSRFAGELDQERRTLATSLLAA